MEKAKSRLGWPDVLRAFAAYSVLLAHLGSYSAYVSLFCFSYVIQLFFFVSGLFAAHRCAQRPGELAVWLLRRLLIPYILLCGVNMAFYGIHRGLPFGGMALDCLLAVRNKMFAPVLWYLPCLIVMIAVYALLRRLVKNRFALLALCCAVSLAFRIFKEQSAWFWSADSALMYLFYYALGDFLMPSLQRLAAGGFHSLGRAGKRLLAALAAVCLALAAFSFRVLSPVDPIVLGDVSVKLLIFLSSAGDILLLAGLAILLQSVRPLQRVGQCTLVISMTQSVTSWLFVNVSWLLGITWSIWADYQVLFYGAALLAFAAVLARPFHLLYALVPSVRRRSPSQDEDDAEGTAAALI